MADEYNDGDYGYGGAPNPSDDPRQPPYGQPPYGAPAYPVGYPPGGSPYPVPRQNNGLALASLIVSLCSVFACGIPGLVGVGLGIAGYRQSRRTGVGKGMSIAGIVIGASFALLMFAWISFLIVISGLG
ncbi:DUF4190 domain-containing protein [Jatrophihabitans sp. DSM 45814]